MRYANNVNANTIINPILTLLKVLVRGSLISHFKFIVKQLFKAERSTTGITIATMLYLRKVVVSPGIEPGSRV